MTVTSDEQSGPTTGAGDLGRRIRERREHLGQSVDELARRAGMAPGYVAYLERRPGANPGLAALTRLAAALETTVTALRGGGIEHPPGAGHHGGAPVLEALGGEDCVRLLEGGGVGRAVFDDVRGPVAIPLNFALRDGELLMRTAEGAIVNAVRSTGRLTFEVDHLDEALGEGWSVLVIGRARVERRPAGRDAGSEAPSEPLPDPWAGGERDELVRLHLDELSGRRIRHRA